jgi:hypothetical protein
VRDDRADFRTSVVPPLKKSLQTRAKRSSSRNQAEAQIEVQMNSRFFRGSALDARQAACIIAAHAARA